MFDADVYLEGYESVGDDGSANQLQQAAGGSAIASWHHVVSSISGPPLAGRERDVLALANKLSRADSELLWLALLSSDSLWWRTPAQLVKYRNSKDDQVRLLATRALLWRCCSCFDRPAWWQACCWPQQVNMSLACAAAS